MNAQNLAFATEPTTDQSLEAEMPKEDYLQWLSEVNSAATGLQTECADVMSVTPGQGGTRGPWLDSISSTLSALQVSLAGAIAAANDEQI